MKLEPEAFVIGGLLLLFSIDILVVLLFPNLNKRKRRE